MGTSVLVVDDSSTIRRIIHRCLEKAALGITEVYEAGNGKEALDLLAKRSFDLVLSDINMPGMDGIQLLSALKENQEWKQIPVFIISTEACAEAVIDAVGKGAVGYIKKPFTPAEIHDRLAPLLRISG